MIEFTSLKQRRIIYFPFVAGCKIHAKLQQVNIRRMMHFPSSLPGSIYLNPCPIASFTFPF
jgi:hypothetical protein